MIYLCIIHTYCHIVHVISISPLTITSPGKRCLYSIFFKKSVEILSCQQQPIRRSAYQGCLDKLQIACINSPACSPEHEREAGVYVFFHCGVLRFSRRYPKRCRFSGQTNWGGEISWSRFFFQIVTSQWPSQTWGTRNQRFSKKNLRGSVLFKIRDVNSWQWIHQTESARWLSWEIPTIRCRNHNLGGKLWEILKSPLNLEPPYSPVMLVMLFEWWKAEDTFFLILEMGLMPCSNCLVYGC